MARALGSRHPRELGPLEIEAFLSPLASEHHVAPSTQNQALSALLFLYVHVLSVPLARLGDFTRAKRPHRATVLTPGEVAAVLNQMRGVPARMVSLLYGAGLRLLECARLRAKDLEFEQRTRSGRSGMYLLADLQRWAEHHAVQARMTGGRLRDRWVGRSGQETE